MNIKDFFLSVLGLDRTFNDNKAVLKAAGFQVITDTRWQFIAYYDYFFIILKPNKAPVFWSSECLRFGPEYYAEVFTQKWRGQDVTMCTDSDGRTWCISEIEGLKPWHTDRKDLYQNVTKQDLLDNGFFLAGKPSDELQLMQHPTAPVYALVVDGVLIGFTEQKPCADPELFDKTTRFYGFLRDTEVPLLQCQSHALSFMMKAGQTCHLADSATAQIDPSVTLPLSLISQEAPRTEGAFTLYGDNSRDDINQLTTVLGSEVINFEYSLRNARLLGQTESLKEILIIDNNWVKNNGYTHTQIGQNLVWCAMVAMRFNPLRTQSHTALHENGHQYTCKFDPSSYTVMITRDDGQTCQTRLGFGIDLVSGLGFYGGIVRRSRTSPETLVEFFKIK